MKKNVYAPEKECKIKDCNKYGKLDKGTGRRYLTKGYCSMHYRRLKIHGSTDIALRVRNTGRIQHELWYTYNNMIARCTNKKNKSYMHYGGRGIKVSGKWLGKHGFDNFIADMGEKPSKEYSIDRIDNDGNYEPDNCSTGNIIYTKIPLHTITISRFQLHQLYS